MTQISDIQSALQCVQRDFATWTGAKLQIALLALMSKATESNDEATANQLWCYQRAVSIHTMYIDAYYALKGGKYYTAWCLLERVEIAYHHLRRHLNLLPEDFGCAMVDDLTTRLQKLFPYKIFASPSYKIRRRECGICRAIITPRGDCGHEIGNLYMGVMCSAIVTEAEMLEISLVTRPRQKYSVMRHTPTEGPSDGYDYLLVDYLLHRWPSPYAQWRMEETRLRHPHEFFSQVSGDDPCPCESGIQYELCCLSCTDGVLRPHYEFTFDFELDEVPPGIQYYYPNLVESEPPVK